MIFLFLAENAVDAEMGIKGKRLKGETLLLRGLWKITLSNYDHPTLENTLSHFLCVLCAK